MDELFPDDDAPTPKRDIRESQLRLGLVAGLVVLGATWIVKTGAWIFLFQWPWLLVLFLAVLGFFAVLGSAVAWILEIVARRFGRPPTALRRNTVLAAWGTACLAIAGEHQLEKWFLPPPPLPNGPPASLPTPIPALDESVQIVTSQEPSSVSIQAAKPHESIPPSGENASPANAPSR